MAVGQQGGAAAVFQPAVDIVAYMQQEYIALKRGGRGEESQLGGTNSGHVVLQARRIKTAAMAANHNFMLNAAGAKRQPHQRADFHRVVNQIGIGGCLKGVCGIGCV